MKLHGEIISKHVDQMRINLHDKNQIVDVFFTKAYKFDVEKLSEKQKIIFSVRIQSVDYYSLKMGKFWLHEILLPAKPPNPSSRHVPGPKNWAQDVVSENKAREANKFEEYPE